MKYFSVYLLFVVLVCGTANSQNDESSNADDKILKELEEKPELMLCFGLFTKIPKDYLVSKISPLTKLLKTKKDADKYYERYIMSAIGACLKRCKSSDLKEVKCP